MIKGVWKNCLYHIGQNLFDDVCDELFALCTYGDQIVHNSFRNSGQSCVLESSVSYVAYNSKECSYYKIF